MRYCLFTLLGVLLAVTLPTFAQGPARPEGIESNGVMMLSVKTMADLAGATMTMGRMGDVTLAKDEVTLTLMPNRPQVMVNNRAVLLSSPVLQVDGIMYAPAGEIGRSLGLRMDWDGKRHMLAVAPPIGKIECYSAGRRLTWTAGDFDGDKNDEVAYAMTNLTGTATTDLWVTRGEATIWQRTIAGAVTALAISTAVGEKKSNLVVTAQVPKGAKQVAVKYIYAWKEGTFKGTVGK